MQAQACRSIEPLKDHICQMNFTSAPTTIIQSPSYSSCSQNGATYPGQEGGMIMCTMLSTQMSHGERLHCALITCPNITL